MSTVFYLGTHEPSWLRHAHIPPLCVSRRRLQRYKSWPVAAQPWMLDSGGFSELSMHGSWRLSTADYVALVSRAATEIGSLAHAAPRDWMCEPFMIARTGLSLTEHLRRTVCDFLDLQQLRPDLPWFPVLQGWDACDYLRCFDAYIDAGVDLPALPLVGVGSICRRQGTAAATSILRQLAGRGVRLHGFGFKTRGILAAQHFLFSCDSMAWSYDARRLGHAACGSTSHRTCSNCLSYALQWSTRLQSRLFITPLC